MLQLYHKELFYQDTPARPCKVDLFVHSFVTCHLNYYYCLVAGAWECEQKAGWGLGIRCRGTFYESDILHRIQPSTVELTEPKAERVVNVYSKKF